MGFLFLWGWARWEVGKVGGFGWGKNDEVDIEWVLRCIYRRVLVGEDGMGWKWGWG